tara:strand:- start:509 stop:619 length:111 start_codon:yes stop_codon:yes gene_type:complete
VEKVVVADLMLEDLVAAVETEELVSLHILMVQELSQ